MSEMSENTNLDLLKQYNKWIALHNWIVENKRINDEYYNTVPNTMAAIDNRNNLLKCNEDEYKLAMQMCDELRESDLIDYEDWFE